MILFEKMQAQGNDFVILNGLQQALPALSISFVQQITERRYGIGCDQLLVLTEHASAHAYMRIFNNDGSEAANCGNGLRCVGDLLLKQFKQDCISIALQDRTVQVRRGHFNHQESIIVDMGCAHIEQQTDAHIDISIGNSHSVFFEATEDFPANRNIEIITGQIADHVYIDIIERGAGRTLACGSGACATAAAIWHNEQHNRPLVIEMTGGLVRVSGDMENIKLEGSVEHVFSGKYYAERT